MAERLSTGFVNAINTTGSVKSVMEYGRQKDKHQ